MIIEAFLSCIKFIVLGIIAILPPIPKFDTSYLDGVFQILSLTDLVIDVKVVAFCITTLIIFMNIELVWSVIMWVVRKIPGIS